MSRARFTESGEEKPRDIALGLGLVLVVLGGLYLVLFVGGEIVQLLFESSFHP